MPRRSRYEAQIPQPRTRVQPTLGNPLLLPATLPALRATLEINGVTLTGSTLTELAVSPVAARRFTQNETSLRRIPVGWPGMTEQTAAQRRVERMEMYRQAYGGGIQNLPAQFGPMPADMEARMKAYYEQFYANMARQTQTFIGVDIETAEMQNLSPTADSIYDTIRECMQSLTRLERPDTLTMSAGQFQAFMDMRPPRGTTTGRLSVSTPTRYTAPVGGFTSRIFNDTFEAAASPLGGHWSDHVIRLNRPQPTDQVRIRHVRETDFATNLQTLRKPEMASTLSELFIAMLTGGSTFKKEFDPHNPYGRPRTPYKPTRGRTSRKPYYSQPLSLEYKFALVVNALFRARPHYQTREIHPLVMDMLRQHEVHPKDMHLLAAECPTWDKERKMIAYTQGIGKMEKDIRTTTTMERYLRRHWPDVEQYKIARWAAAYKPIEGIISDQVQDFIDAVEDGPYSCMQNLGYDTHPYEVYSPKLGWKIAMRMEGDQIRGRALIYEPEKCFVRTYEYVDGETSNPDERLKAWLKDQGYELKSGWPNRAKLAKIYHSNSQLLIPYLDGGADMVNVFEDHLEIVRSGKYSAGYSDAVVSVNEEDYEDYNADDYSKCDSCDNRVDSDTTELAENGCEVCPSCIRTYYSYALFWNGGEEDSGYFPDSEVTWVDGKAYATKDMHNFDLVELHDGCWCGIDDAVDVHGEWYHKREDLAETKTDPSPIVKYSDDEYGLRTDSRWCDFSEEWVRESDSYLLKNGNYVEEAYLSNFCVDLTEAQIRDLICEGDVKGILEQVAEIKADARAEIEAEEAVQTAVDLVMAENPLLKMLASLTQPIPAPRPVKEKS